MSKILGYQYKVSYSIAYDDPTTAVSAYSVSHGTLIENYKADKNFNGSPFIHKTNTLVEYYKPLVGWKIKKKQNIFQRLFKTLIV